MRIFAVISLMLILLGTQSTGAQRSRDPDVVTGKPFMARYRLTVNHHPKNQPERVEITIGALYRDGKGRTRDETLQGLGDKRALSASIDDPVADKAWIILPALRRVMFRGKSGSIAKLREIEMNGETTYGLPLGFPPGDRISTGWKSMGGLLCEGYRVDRPKYKAEVWSSSQLDEITFEKLTTEDSVYTYALYDIRETEPEMDRFIIPADYADIPWGGPSMSEPHTGHQRRGTSVER